MYLVTIYSCSKNMKRSVFLFNFSKWYDLKPGNLWCCCSSQGFTNLIIATDIGAIIHISSGGQRSTIYHISIWSNWYYTWALGNGHLDNWNSDSTQPKQSPAWTWFELNLSFAKICTYISVITIWSSPNPWICSCIIIDVLVQSLRLFRYLTLDGWPILQMSALIFFSLTRIEYLMNSFKNTW